MFEIDEKKLLTLLEKEKMTIAEYTMQHEESLNPQISRLEIRKNMQKCLDVMKTSATQAKNRPITSVSGLTGGNAYKYSQYVLNNQSICGDIISNAIGMALSCSEVNASMNRIVACPTAGSCGIVPAAILSVSQKYEKTEDEIIDSLFTASGIGLLIGAKATLSGAEGGCQAECGSASAMAAAAIVELMGGSPRMAFNAAAISLKTVLGLVCDPVAGLVEIPCIKRNASGTVNAIACADMALAGVESYIPFGEVVDAMFSIGKNMSTDLKETALGGLAITKTGLEMKERVKSK